MRQEITQTISTSAATLATSTGILTSVLAFLGSNAAGIGAGSTLIFGVIYVYFQWSSNKKLTIAEINSIKVKGLEQSLADHKDETNKQFDVVNSGIDSILKIVKGK